MLALELGAKPESEREPLRYPSNPIPAPEATPAATRKGHPQECAATDAARRAAIFAAVDAAASNLEGCSIKHSCQPTARENPA